MEPYNASEFAHFLKSRRARLSPATVGLQQGVRRRTPGLRREEVAELAGIGIDWYVRLEQGRNARPSATTVDALARALKLTAAEHEHLRDLAGMNLCRVWSREVVPQPLETVVKSLPHPAYVTGRRWDVLVWNVAADELFDFRRMAEADRNLFLSMLTTPAARRRFGAEWEDEARRMIALFRADYDIFANDPSFRALVALVAEGCEEFLGWWTAHDVRSPTGGQKKLKRSKQGVISFDYATFQSNDNPDLKLALYAPTPAHC